MPPPELVLAETRAWVERVVIGLKLCPFAAVPQAAGQVRYVYSDDATPGSLLETLAAELELLAETPPRKIETTLLVHPQVLTGFAEYNEFLDLVDELLETLDLEGVIQVASFHPDYQYAETGFDDISNATNRSPYPTLHLLREDSLEAAIATHPDPDTIFEANISTFEALGAAGWSDLQARYRAEAQATASSTRPPSNTKPG
jgi:hypothetical protein